MKKVSTVAGKQSRNFSQPKLTIGLDLGDRWSWYCVLDETGSIVQEQKLGTTAKAMKEEFGRLPRCRIRIPPVAAVEERPEISPIRIPPGFN
jgi:transposase